LRDCGGLDLIWDYNREETTSDYLHEADISGGPPYGIELPFAGANPIFSNEEHAPPFIDYLRLAFHWAGLRTVLIVVQSGP
jgi:hypothetical protein